MFKETKAVLHGAHDNIGRWLLVQQTATASISRTVTDCDDFVSGQSWDAKHASALEGLTQTLGQWNDDLVGFFNAVPRKDVLQAAIDITEEYQKRTGCEVLSIDLQSTTGHLGEGRVPA